MDNTYTTAEQIEAFIGRELTENEQVLLPGIFAEVVSLINSYTGRNWHDHLEGGEEVDPTTRYYSGNGLREIFIDDYTSLDTIEFLDSQGNVYQTVDNADDYLSFPSNADVKQSLTVRNFHIPSGTANIKITGVFDSGEVPALVTAVATSLAVSLLGNIGEAKQFKKESIEGYSYELASEADAGSDVDAILQRLGSLRRIIL